MTIMHLLRFIRDTIPVRRCLSSRILMPTKPDSTFTAHYENIYVVDLRLNGKLFQLMEQYEPEQGMDVLVLHDCIHF